MKTTISRAILTFFTLVILAVFISFANMSARIQTASLTMQQPGTELPGHSYSELLNGLAAGGR